MYFNNEKLCSILYTITNKTPIFLYRIQILDKIYTLLFYQYSLRSDKYFNLIYKYTSNKLKLNSISSTVSIKFFIKKENKIEPIVKELPLRIDKIPLTFNIVNNGAEQTLEVNYTNNSKETITRLMLDIQLKDTQETIQLSSNEAIQPGQTSTLYAAKAPASGNVDDIEILKYKISLLSGVYMEYDTKLKQYNWS